MKLICLFMFVALVQVSASSYAQSAKLNISGNNLTLEEVFEKIEDQSEFSFIYNLKQIDLSKKVNVEFRNEKVDKILDQVLEGTNITYTVNNRLIVVHRDGEASVLLSTVNQQKSVSGKVIDEQGETLPGVTVLIKGTTNGTVTNFDGEYTISNVPEGASLQFSFVGMLTQEISIGNQTQIDISMKVDAIGIEEVVAIGYGTMRKSDLTGSIASISSDQIIQGASTSATRAIQGKAAGVRVTQKTGRPGDGVTIRIRGGNSLSGGNEPLYVVDGFPVNGLGADFNPEDIASMEILKDASSTAIYGSRGANGVVLITTKQGKEGSAKIDYHGYYGVQSLRKKLDLLDKNDFVAMQNEIATREGGTLLTPGEIAALPNNDWQDLAYQNAIMQSHQISASGGGKKATFYTSLNYMDQEGILKGSDFNRVGARINGKVRVNEKLTVNANIGLNRSIDNNSNFAADGWGAIPFQAITMAPTTPIYDENGNYTKFTGTPWGGTNPVGYTEMDMNTTTIYRVISNVSFDYKIIDGLVLKVSAGADVNSRTQDQYSKIGISNGGPKDGQARKNMSKFQRFVNENILNYTKVINENNRFSAMAGFSYQESITDYMNSGRYSGFVSDIFENNNMQSAINTVPLSTGYSDSKLISYLGRFNYTFKERYLFTATGRYDGSSKFGLNNKYAFFPSTAIAWRISEESFMDDVSWIDNLKVRASYGQVGSQAISPYQTLDRLGINTPVFGSGEGVGFVASGFSNQDLRWETTTQTDIGLDMSILESRFNLVLDYYKKNTTDLLYRATLPPSSGYGSSVRNVGEIENKGFELELSYRNLEGAVKLNSSLNVSINRSTVVDLGTDNDGNIIERIDSPIAGGNWFPLFLNKSPFQLYGFEIEGIYQTDAEADAREPGKIAGEYKIRDIKADGVINGEDQTLLTNLEPSFIFGMNNDISYKNFNLSFLIVGSYGNDIVNEFNKYYTALGGTWNVTQEAWDNRWTGPGSSGTFAGASTSAKNNITFGSPSSLWVEDGSYVRLKDIKLSYTLPKTIVNRLKMDNVSVYISGSNLLTWTNYPHYDPEASWTSSSVNGWDRGVYPASKSVIGGIQVKF